MAHHLQNPSARDSAKKKLLQALNGAEINLDKLPGWDKRLKPFIDEALKSIDTWMTANDLLELIVWNYFMSPARSESQVGTLSTLWSAHDIDELAEKIISEITSPRVYYIDLPAPQLKIERDIKLSENVALALLPKKARLGVRNGGGIFETRLRVQVQGYVFSGRSQSAFVEAMRLVKYTLLLGALRGFFTRAPQKKPSFVFTKERHQDLYDARVTRVDDPATSYEIALTAGLSSYLSELSFSAGPWQDTFEGSILGYLGRDLEMLACDTAKDNVKSLRRSLEWAFDAQTDEDEHMQFIKTCIGLEAAISEQSDDIGITEQLADRCAFLLNKTSVERKLTRDLIKKIYRLRSKLVHGVSAGLASTERELARQAGRILNRILLIELDATLEWWQKHRSKM